MRHNVAKKVAFVSMLMLRYSTQSYSMSEKNSDALLNYGFQAFHRRKFYIMKEYCPYIQISNEVFHCSSRFGRYL